MGDGKPETACQMMEALGDFVFGEEPDFRTMPSKEVSAFLSEHGLDVEPVSKAVASALAASRDRLDLEIARQKRLGLVSKAGAIPPRRGLREHLLAQIEAIAGSSRSAVYARKFEDAPDADLESLLEDFEFLEQLDFDEDEK